MSNLINITQPIENDSLFGEKGFVDQTFDKITSCEGELNALVDSPGGDIFKAAVIERAVSQHYDVTKAEVYGLAASAAALLLASFDVVTADVDSRFMLHSARPASGNVEDLSESEKNEIKVFNDKAKRKIIKKGRIKGVDNEDLVNSIFNDPNGDDYWFSATEAKDLLGIVDEVTEVERKNNSPVVTKISARANEAKIIYNKYVKDKMNFFKNKKNESNVVRTLELKDGRSIVFNSETEALTKGCLASLIGSNEGLKGEQIFKNGIKAIFDEDNKVTEIVDETETNSEMDQETMQMFSEIKEMLTSIEERVSKLEGGEEGEGAEDTEARVSEIENSLQELSNQLINKQLVTKFKLPKFENKNEKIHTGLSPEREHVNGLRSVLNEEK